MGPIPSTPLPGNAVSRRRFLSALGISAAAIGSTSVLSACGGGSSGLSGDEGGSGGGKKATLNVWYHQYGEAGTQQAVERYAKEFPDATVKVQWTPGDYTSKVNSGLLSNNGPDSFEGTPNLQQVKADQIVPLDDILADVKSDYTEADIKSITVEGKMYGARIVDDCTLIYYRKSMLDKAGVKPPTTLDELVAAAKELTTKDVKGLFIGNDAGATPAFGGGSMLGPVLWSVGQNYLTDDNKINFTGDNVAKAMMKLRKLVTDKSILLGAPTDYWDSGSFTQGLCAMQYTGLWAMPIIQKAIGDDFGVVPFPAFSDSVGKPSTAQGGWAAMVSKKSKNVELAKKYVKWLWVDNTKDQEDYNLSYGFHVPPRKSLAAKASKLQSGPAAEAVKIFNDYAIAGGTTWTTEMNTAWGDAMTAVIRKGKDPDASIATAEKAVQKILDKLLG
ncbi:ABC transporter substrate-binding protein [Microlunatus soli]|uniref:Multiple sugar transport system substrate-binding protein n=1 Tax=Microlunatus soli TaxID=630515 RepID=A0A1H1UVF9_9ACTN|nr:sugar ABC transporter substrate-binding protein [Microlunatus soli]SDS76465.1 multiple sugar transport system substrate-binding protein [Microlunatus soli]